MFERDSECKAYALEAWANYIETGDLVTSRHDAAAIKRPVNVLTDQQQDFVRRLRRLAAQERAS